MKIIKPQTLGLLTRPFEFRREFWLGISVLAFLPIGETPLLLKETEMWSFLAEELPPDLPLDAAIPKLQPEFLAISHCYAPGDVAAPLVHTGIQLGPVIKQLDVHGDRMFDRSRRRLGEAVPFTQMALDWTRTYGGAGFADNPVGKGVPPGQEMQSFPVQNVLNPALGQDGARVPVAYGPVDQMWPARARLVGTHDDSWLKQDFPGFARDIDWHFFNLAQPDQWLPQPLNGDETYAFKNLHPRQPLLQGRLPGMAARLFLTKNRRRDGGREAGDGGFEEVPLRLTTVWFFPHRERLVLVHHGQARLAEEDAADIGRVVVGADRLGSLRAAEEYRAVMVKRADTKGGGIHALRDADLVPAEWLALAAAAPDAEPSRPELALSRARQRAEREQMAAREKLKQHGLNPNTFDPQPPPPPRPAPTLAELPAFAAAARAEAAEQQAKAAAEAAAIKADAAARLAAAGMPDAEIQQRLNPKSQGPPAFSAAAMREQLTQQINAGRVFGQLTDELEDQLVSPEFLAQLDAAEAGIRNSYRLSAHLQEPTDVLPAERSAELRRWLAADTAAARALYDLHGADLSGLDLSGLDLSGICLDSANLAGTRLAGANLSNAVLAHAALRDCVLDGANLSGANLGKAHLQGASLNNAVLKRTILAGADLTDASLANADLEGADLSEAVISGTNFSAVHAPGILAMKLSLPGLRAPGIVLTKAKFVECNLQGADLTAAKLERAVFLACNLSGISLGHARLRKAVFVKQCSLIGAHLTGADMTEANLRETKLSGADLDRAILVQADFSKADLSNALLHLARGKACQLVAADLRRADMRDADFANADLSRADLRGANLSGMSVYEANLARARLDEATTRRGMFRVRMRYLPVYEPPQEAPA
ncbi:MAG TPA: DUF2169 domain-containing protein [Acetobacteraceae bacterium]|nr:DUF2169 domain-containing protein [Acetobacteraceae bacterium]